VYNNSRELLLRVLLIKRSRTVR